MKSMRDLYSPRPDDFDMGRKTRKMFRREGGRAFVAFQKRLARRASRHAGAARAIAEGLEEVYLDAIQSLDQELFEESVADLFEALRKRMGWPF
jgi:hypothetical protein